MQIGMIRLKAGILCLMLFSFLILPGCLAGQGSGSPKQFLSTLDITNVTTSSRTNESHYLVDGDNSTSWSSSERISPGRREWIKLTLLNHSEVWKLVLKPSPEGGFPTGLQVSYSTDGGAIWYRVHGAELSQYPDPGTEDVVISFPSQVANALMVEALYLRKDKLGKYTFRLAEINIEGSTEMGPFFTSRGGQWDADLNMMWKIFGSASDGSGAVAPMGGESAWLEWNALKLCWFEDETLRRALRDQFIQYTVGLDGYVWSWGNMEGWPTHGRRHYESNPKFILGACRYYLWSGDDDFLQSHVSTTTDMSFSIRYEGKTIMRWDSLSHIPVRLEEGGTLGQSFKAYENFTAVGGSFPTYLTSGSGMTLRLRKEDPQGEVVFEEQFTNVIDNSWMTLEFDPMPPGQYYLEMSDPVGIIGWWSINDDVMPLGQSYVIHSC